MQIQLFSFFISKNHQTKYSMYLGQKQHCKTLKIPDCTSKQKPHSTKSTSPTRLFFESQKVPAVFILFLWRSLTIQTRFYWIFQIVILSITLTIHKQILKTNINTIMNHIKTQNIDRFKNIQRERRYIHIDKENKREQETRTRNKNKYAIISTHTPTQIRKRIPFIQNHRQTRWYGFDP